MKFGSKGAEKVTSENENFKIYQYHYLPIMLKLAERKIDERHLRKEIKIVIQNIRGVRTGLFTPDMAFERIVKEQIAQLVTAPIQLVDQVTNEIVGAVRNCSQVFLT